MATERTAADMVRTYADLLDLAKGDERAQSAEYILQGYDLDDLRQLQASLSVSAAETMAVVVFVQEEITARLMRQNPDGLDLFSELF